MPGERRRRKQERPAEILEAAFEEFRTQGFAATRLDDIAKRAGITKGTIYVYFPSKEDLFVAALKEQTLSFEQNLDDLLAEPRGRASDILRSHLDFVAGHMVRDPCKRDVMRILMAEGERFPEVVDRWHEEVIGPAIERIGAVLRYGIETGEFRSAAARDFPLLILSPIMLAVNWLTIFGDRRPIDVTRYFAAAADLLIAGLMA